MGEKVPRWSGKVEEGGKKVFSSALGTSSVLPSPLGGSPRWFAVVGFKIFYSTPVEPFGVLLLPGRVHEPKGQLCVHTHTSLAHA